MFCVHITYEFFSPPRTGSKLGISPLMLAAMNGHTAAVKLLLDMGSDINAQIETNRNTALTLACFQGRTEVVSLLLDRKANVEHRAKVNSNFWFTYLLFMFIRTMCIFVILGLIRCKGLVESNLGCDRKLCFGCLKAFFFGLAPFLLLLVGMCWPEGVKRTSLLAVLVGKRQKELSKSMAYHLFSGW